MGLPFGFLFKMGEISHISPLATRGILDRTVKRAVTFLFFKKGLWITRVPLWIVYEVGNSVLSPKHIRNGLSEF